jgi:hypothetical protein
VEPPPRLVHNILEHNLGPQKAPAGWGAVLEWLWPKAHPRFAMGLVTVALAVAVVAPTLGIEWSKLTWADLYPANIYNAADRRVHLMYARGVKFVNDLRVVYEIQTRLEPQQEPPPQPQPRAPGSTESQPDPRRQRDLNRANELNLPRVLASAFPGVPRRSLR